MHCPELHGCRWPGLLSQMAFANPVRLCWCITSPAWPLESTNQNWLCARLLPIAISIYLVVCVYSCRLLGSQQHCLCPNGREGSPSPCPPTPTTTHPSHPPLLISDNCDIKVVKKTISKSSSDYCTAELAMKQ